MVVGEGVRGTHCASRNPNREFLTLKIIGAGPGVQIFISEQEYVTIRDFFLDANDPLDTGIMVKTQNDLWCAALFPGIEIVILETTIDEGGM